MVPVNTPHYSESAAKKELQRILKSGSLEVVHHAAPWCSRALCVQKPGSPDEDPSVRMVTNLQKVNQAIKRIGYPMDGAFHNLRRLNPQDTHFSVVDLCQGFPLQRRTGISLNSPVLHKKILYLFAP